MIDAGASTDEVVAGWRDELRAFRRIERITSSTDEP